MLQYKVRKKQDTEKSMKGRRAEQRHNKLRDFAASLCFLSPSLLGVGVFFILPFGVVVYYSLIDGVASHRFVLFENFRKLLGNSAFLLAGRNTLLFSAIAVPLAVLLSLGLAVMLEARIPGKSTFRTFFLSPMMVPVASVVLIWQVLFSYNGSVNEWLGLAGSARIDWLQSDWNIYVVVLLFLWKNVSPSFLPSSATASPSTRTTSLMVRYSFPSLRSQTIPYVVPAVGVTSFQRPVPPLFGKFAPR